MNYRRADSEFSGTKREVSHLLTQSDLSFFGFEWWVAPFSNISVPFLFEFELYSYPEQLAILLVFIHNSKLVMKGIVPGHYERHRQFYPASQFGDLGRITIRL